MKYDLIIALFKKGFTMDEITELKLGNITTKGISYNGKSAALELEEVKYLAQYLQKYDRKLENFLFPAKGGEQNTARSLIASMRLWAKKANIDLHELGIITVRGKKLFPENPSMDDIMKYLKEKKSG